MAIAACASDITPSSTTQPDERGTGAYTDSDSGLYNRLPDEDRASVRDIGNLIDGQQDQPAGKILGGGPVSDNERDLDDSNWRAARPRAFLRTKAMYRLPMLGFDDWASYPSVSVQWKDGTVICRGVLGDMSPKTLAREKAEEARKERLRSRMWCSWKIGAEKNPEQSQQKQLFRSGN